MDAKVQFVLLKKEIYTPFGGEMKIFQALKRSKNFFGRKNGLSRILMTSDLNPKSHPCYLSANQIIDLK